MNHLLVYLQEKLSDILSFKTNAWIDLILLFALDFFFLYYMTRFRLEPWQKYICNINIY